MAGLIFRKTKKTLNYLEEKPEVYSLQNITLPKVTWQEMVDEISRTQGCTAAQTQAVINALLDRTVLMIKLGHPVSLGSVGTFKPTYRSKVSATRENLSAENVVQKYLRYIPGKELRKTMAEMPVNSYDNLDQV